MGKLLNVNRVLQTMLDGEIYSSQELAHLSEVNHYEVCRILIHLGVTKEIKILGIGLLPRKRRYVKLLTSQIKCSPDILPLELLVSQPEPIRNLRSVK